jgi:hypothetical protein
VIKVLPCISGTPCRYTKPIFEIERTVRENVRVELSKILCKRRNIKEIT